jgi:hypothetical protein
MTRTDVMASSRPQTAGATPTSRGSSRSLHGRWALPVVALVALALALPAAAAAAEPTAGYNQEPNKPTTTTTPKTGTSPSKEAVTPTKEVAPTSTSTTPTTSAKASTLPFTGFDLRWDLGFGVALMGAGLAILAMLRRQRRHGGG